MARIDESQIVDRDDEVAILNGMLDFQTPRRVLTVSGKSGMGKSDVLRRLRHECEVTLSVPAALIDLRVFESRPDVFKLVLELREALHDGGARFPTFDALNAARAFQNSSHFLDQLRAVNALLDAHEAKIGGQARVAGIMFNIENAGNVQLPAWNDQAEVEAQSLCREAFLADLLDYAAGHPVVLLFDTVDKANEELRRWLFLELINRRLLAGWERHRLIVVVAGQEVKSMLSARLKPVHVPCVESIAAPWKWEFNHVREFLRVHGFRDLSDDDVKNIHDMLSRGKTLSCALLVAQALTAEMCA
jgi:hypothetical protein